LPAEIAGTLVAVVVATLIWHSSKNRVLAAYIGSMSETFGFYTAIIIKDVCMMRKELKAEGKLFTPKAYLVICRNLLVDFGPSELLDSLAIRPFLMYFFPQIIGNYEVGVLIGKVLSDIFFFIPVAISYELRQKVKERRKADERAR